MLAKYRGDESEDTMTESEERVKKKENKVKYAEKDVHLESDGVRI